MIFAGGFRLLIKLDKKFLSLITDRWIMKTRYVIFLN